MSFYVIIIIITKKTDEKNRKPQEINKTTG